MRCVGRALQEVVENTSVHSGGWLVGCGVSGSSNPSRA